MTETRQQCQAPTCGRPTSGATLCRKHTGELHKLATDLPSWIDDLITTLTRQSRTTTTRGPAGEAPLPFNNRASKLLHQIVLTINTWQPRIADHTGQPVRITDTIRAAAWIATTLRTHHTANLPDAGRLLTDLQDHTHKIQKLVDRPEAKWYAGRCGKLTTTFHDDGTFTIDECQRELYADAETGIIKCPLCGNTHDIATRRAALLANAEHVLATATEAARAIVVWSDYQRGETRLVNRIGTWAERRRIEQHGTIRQGGRDRPLYRIGDILDLLAEDDHDAKTKQTAS